MYQYHKLKCLRSVRISKFGIFAVRCEARLRICEAYTYLWQQSGSDSKLGICGVFQPTHYWELQNTSGFECRLLDTVLEPTEKGTLTQSQQQIWNLEKTLQCLSLSNTNAIEISHEIAWVRTWGTRKIKNALRLFSDSILTEIHTCAVSLLRSALHREHSQYRDNRYEIYATALRKIILTHDHVPNYWSLETHPNNSYLIIMFSSHIQHAASPIQISTV
jgi:hypothetical protein